MNFVSNNDQYCELPNTDLSSYITLYTGLCAGSVSLNPTEKLGSNWNAN